ncbi:MAG: hypothetical protein VCD00_20760 [Candidatus Hydrogenedentota bacterium]
MKTSVTTALKQAHELIEHAQRNNLPPDLHWLAQLGRAYSSSVHGEISDTRRTQEEKQGLLDKQCNELSDALDAFEIPTDPVEDVAQNDDGAEPDPESEHASEDTFTPEQNRSLLERCIQRLRGKS